MKKFVIILIAFVIHLSFKGQQTLFFDDFESYNNGDSVVNLSNFQGWGANGCGVAVNDPGNGAGNSDQYFFTTDGYMALQIIDSVVPGETYRFSMNGALTGWNQNGIKFQIVQLNAPGNADDVLLVDFTLGSVGGGQQNTFKLIDTTYTAQATDTSNLAFKITKNWGPGYKIDNFKVECISCLDCSNPNHIPTVNAGQDQSICLGGSTTLQTTFVSGASYSWSPTTGLSNPNSNLTSASPANTTTYTVTVTLNGCTSSDQVTLSVLNGLPYFTAGPDVSFCRGSSIALNATSYPGATYSWSPTIGLSNPNSSSTIASHNVSVYYTVSCTLNGCTAVDNIMVNVFPLPNVDAGQDLTICIGDGVTLNGSGANTYSWSNGVQDGVMFVPVSNQPNAVTTNTYTVTGTDQNNCQRTDQVQVTINPLPNVVGTASIEGEFLAIGEICLGDSIKLVGSGANSYVWDQGVIDNTYFEPSQSTIYVVTGTDINDCDNTADVEITVNELPEIDTAITNEYYGGDGAIDLTLYGGLPPYTIDWDIDGLGDKDDNMDVDNLEGGVYQVIVTDDNGCKSTLLINVEHMTILVIPSAITPNSDGYNDVWDIVGLDNYPEMVLQVFDRYGQVVYEQRRQYTDWDGEFRGKNVPQGDYFYIIDLKNGEVPYKGTVSVKY